MMGDPEGALEQFDKALEVNDCYAEALMNRAIALNDLNRHDEASGCFPSCERLGSPRFPCVPIHMGNQLANAHARTGDLYMAADRPEEAATEYAAAVEVRPSFLDLRFKLAEAYMDLERLGEALTHLEEILVANPNFAGARVRLGASSIDWETRIERGRNGSSVAEQNPDDRRIRAYLASLDS